MWTKKIFIYNQHIMDDAIVISLLIAIVILLSLQLMAFVMVHYTTLKAALIGQSNVDSPERHSEPPVDQRFSYSNQTSINSNISSLPPTTLSHTPTTQPRSSSQLDIVPWEIFYDPTLYPTQSNMLDPFHSSQHPRRPSPSSDQTIRPPRNRRPSTTERAGYSSQFISCNPIGPTNMNNEEEMELTEMGMDI